MIDTFKHRTAILIFFLPIIFIVGCASTAPLPSNITFIEPSPKTSRNLSALLGVWKGRWYSSQDATLIVESVDSNYTEVIFSLGALAAGGLNPQNSFYYVRGEVLSDTAFGWSTANNNRFIFEIQDGFKEIKGYFIEGSTGAKINATFIRSTVDALSNVTIHKYPYVEYTHPAKGDKEFEHDNNLCWREAEKKTTLLSVDVRRYKMWEELNRCLRDDYEWKPADNNSKADVRL